MARGFALFSGVVFAGTINRCSSLKTDGSVLGVCFLKSLKLALFLFAVAASHSTCGQQLFLQKYPLDIYGGAAANFDMAEDSQGYKFFANADGVLIFDGIHWQLISLPGNESVMALKAGKAGKIYVGAYQEFGFIEKDHHGDFQYHSLLHFLPEKFQNQVGDVASVEAVGDEVFFGDLANLYIFNDTIANVIPDQQYDLMAFRDSLYGIDSTATNFHIYTNRQFVLRHPNVNKGDVAFIMDYKDTALLILDHKKNLRVINPNLQAADNLRNFNEGMNNLLKGFKTVSRIRLLSSGLFAILADDQIVFAEL